MDDLSLEDLMDTDFTSLFTTPTTPSEMGTSVQATEQHGSHPFTHGPVNIPDFSNDIFTNTYTANENLTTPVTETNHNIGTETDRDVSDVSESILRRRDHLLQGNNYVSEQAQSPTEYQPFSVPHDGSGASIHTFPVQQARAPVPYGQHNPSSNRRPSGHASSVEDRPPADVYQPTFASRFNQAPYQATSVMDSPIPRAYNVRSKSNQDVYPSTPAESKSSQGVFASTSVESKSKLRVRYSSSVEDKPQLHYQPSNYSAHSEEDWSTLSHISADYINPPSVQSVQSEMSVMSEDMPQEPRTFTRSFPNNDIGGRGVQYYLQLCGVMSGSGNEGGADQLCVGSERSTRYWEQYISQCVRMAQVDMAQVQEIAAEATRNKKETLDIPFCTSPRCLCMTEFLKNDLHKEKNAGLQFMHALFGFIMTLQKVHNDLKSCHGVFSALDCLVMKIGKHRRMPVYLLPVVSNLTEAAVRVSQCEDVSAVRKGMLDDVKALGRILQEVLPYLDSYDLHISERMKDNIKTALDSCNCSSSGADLAKVVKILQIERRICTLNFEEYDIVCYKGEKIGDVVDRWLLQTTGKKLNQHKLKMVYTAQKSVPVQRDHEVTEPSSEVSCQSATI